MTRGARRLAVPWMWRVALTVVIGLTLCGQAAPVVAAGRPTDLAAVLVRPHSSGHWIPIPNGVEGNFHYGPLDANAIAEASTDPPAILSELVDQQFTRGYQRGWRQEAGYNLLQEEVEEFRYDGGAADHLAKGKGPPQPNSGCEGPFDTPGLDDGSGLQCQDRFGNHQVLVAFTKGNLMFFVVARSDKPLNTDTVVNQARYVYLAAPDESTIPGTTLPGQPKSSVNIIPSLLTSGPIEIIGVAVLMVLALGLLAGLAVPTLRRQAGARRGGKEGRPR